MRIQHVLPVLEGLGNVCDFIQKLDSRLSKVESAGYKDMTNNEPSDLNIDDCEKVIDGIVDELPLLCDKCDLRFKTNTELNEHSKIQHPNLNMLKCKECVYQSDSQDEINLHEAGHKPYACTICEFRSASSDELGIHMTIHTEEKTFSCSECGSEFDNEISLVSHKNEHKGENIIACYICDSKFATRDELKVHMSTHNKVNPGDELNKQPQDEKNEHTIYACTECDFKAVSQAQCKMHMEMHKPSSVNTMRYNACFVCDAKFTTLDELKLHMAEHTEEKAHKCTECDYKCNDKLLLQHHMNDHNGEKPDFMSDAQFPPLSDMGAAWSFNDLARQHLVETLFNKDGWSRPFMNGKQMKTKDMFKPNPVEPRNNNKNNNNNNTKFNSNNNINGNNFHNKNRYRSDAIIGTGKGSNLAIQNKKYNASLFATRFEPDTNAASIKRDLEANLLRITGTMHIVTVEKLTTKYDHYASFKISCSCDNTAVFTNSELWPENILVRWWRSPRKGINTNNH